MNHLAALFLLITTLLLSACSNQETPKTENNTAEPPLIITGTAAVGLLSQASIVAYSLDKASELGRTTSDKNGFYHLEMETHNGPVLLEVTTTNETEMICPSADGCEEGIHFGDSYTFDNADFLLSAIFADASMSGTYQQMTSPLTHLSAQRSLHEGLASTQEVVAMNTATARLFSLRGINIATQPLIDISNTDAIEDAEKESVLVSAINGAFLGELKPLTQSYIDLGGLLGYSEDDAAISLNKLLNTAINIIDASIPVTEENTLHINLSFVRSLLTLSKTVHFKQDSNQIVQSEYKASSASEAPLSDTDKGELLTSKLNKLNQTISSLEPTASTDRFATPLLRAKHLVNHQNRKNALIRKRYQLIETNNQIGPAMKAHEVTLNLMLLSDFINSKTSQRTGSFSYSLSQAIDEGFRHPGLRSVTDTGADVNIQVSPITAEDSIRYQDSRLFEYSYLINTQHHYEQVSANLMVPEKTAREPNSPDLDIEFDTLTIHSYDPTSDAPAIRITNGYSLITRIGYHEKDTSQHRDLNEVIKNPLNSDVRRFDLEFSLTLSSDGIEKEKNMSLLTTLIKHQTRGNLLLFILYGNSQYNNGEKSSGELRWSATPTLEQEPLSFSNGNNLTLNSGFISYFDYFDTSIADNIIKWHGDTEFDSAFFKSDAPPALTHTQFVGKIEPKTGYYREFDGNIDSRLIRINGEPNNPDALKYYVADAVYSGLFSDPEKRLGKRFDGSLVISANNYQASNTDSSTPFYQPEQINAYLSTTLEDQNQNSIDVDIFASGLAASSSEAEAVIDLDGYILKIHYDSIGLDRLNKKIKISSDNAVLDLEVACPAPDVQLSECDKGLSYQGELRVEDEVAATIEYKEDKPFLMFNDGTESEFVFDFIL